MGKNELVAQDYNNNNEIIIIVKIYNKKYFVCHGYPPS